MLAVWLFFVIHHNIRTNPFEYVTPAEEVTIVHKLRMLIIKKWRALRHRHPDGTMHDWKVLSEAECVQLGLPTHHVCEWDYCSCYRRQCSICKAIERVSDGVDEIR